MSARNGISAIAEGVRRAEARLERAVAAGWRNADADLERLAADVAALERVGLADLTARLRQVGAAPSAERLDRAALALAACRLTRAHLAESGVPSGNWEPVVAQTRRVAAARIVPFGRLALNDREVWAAARVSGYASDLILVEPFPVETPPWFDRPIQGRLSWRARYPLGASGDVQLAALAEPRQVRDDHANADVLTDFRQAVASNKLADGQPILPWSGKLQIKRLSPDDAPACAWPHPSVAAAFAAIAWKEVWTVCYVDGQVVTPLVVIDPPGFFRSARLIHLVDGTTAEPFPS
jgi:hypothetical protein